MKAFRYAAVAALILGFIFHTTYSSADTASIEKRLADLEAEVAILKRQLEIEKEAKVQKAPETPIVTASSKDGFSIKSPDESFKLKIRGLLQVDGRFFLDNQKDNGTTDTFLVRRARPIFEGTVGKNLDFYLMPDFGNGQSTLVDAYADYKLAPAWKIRGGKFKAPLGLERLQSDAVSNFTEIGLPSNLLPNREIGFQLSGDVLGESVNYAIGVFNGSLDSASSNGQDADTNSDKDVIGRVFVQPFKNAGPEKLKGLGVGVGGSYGHREGALSATAPVYRSAGQATIFSYSTAPTVFADGAHVRVSPQAYFYSGSFGILGEYAISQQALSRTVGGVVTRENYANTAWQVTGNYVLTGELASYKGITPRKNFDLAQGTWGAWEVVGRIGQLSIDNSIFDDGFASSATSVSQANEWGTGINWYLNKNLRLSLDYLQTRFVGGAAFGLDRKTENAILSRFQVAY